MAGSASTERMYRGDKDENLPRSAQEAYNATQSDKPAQISDEPGPEYDQGLMGDAIQAYENFRAEPEYAGDQLLEDEDALEAFGELWSEN